MCFADEAGLYRTCETLCVAVVCFPVVHGVERAGLDVYERIRGMLGLRRGELKFRVVARAAARHGVELGMVLRVIEEGSVGVACSCGHVDDVAALQALKERLLVDAVRRVGVRATTLYVDEGLLPPRDFILGRVRRKTRVKAVKLSPSDRLAGIQLADVYGGYCREGAERG